MAIAQVSRPRMTAEELQSAAQDRSVELIEGEMVEMSPSGHRHSRIAFALTKLFEAHCQARNNLDFAPENVGFWIQRNPDTVLAPDCALFSRRPSDDGPWLEFAPEIVVEVVSPSNNRMEMALKRHRYFDAGTEQFWLVHPDEEKIEFHFRDGRLITASGDETIQGEGLAAGMNIVLKDVFRPR